MVVNAAPGYSPSTRDIWRAFGAVLTFESSSLGTSLLGADMTTILMYQMYSVVVTNSI